HIPQRQRKLDERRRIRYVHPQQLGTGRPMRYAQALLVRQRWERTDSSWVGVDRDVTYLELTVELLGDAPISIYDTLVVDCFGSLFLMAVQEMSSEEDWINYRHRRLCAKGYGTPIPKNWEIV